MPTIIISSLFFSLLVCFLKYDASVGFYLRSPDKGGGIQHLCFSPIFTVVGVGKETEEGKCAGRSRERGRRMQAAKLACPPGFNVLPQLADLFRFSSERLVS
ncbi:hypothetical protein Q8A73_023293 [Channa argus]|nr:hypothetical protein Q8A73_023293 [Channa argus]